MDSPAIKDLPMNPGGETTAAVAIVVWVLAAIFVGLRFLARRSPVKPGVDDWVSLLSLVPALGLCICTVIWATLGGLGWHTDQLSHRQSMNSLKVFWVVQWCFTFTCAITKTSILLLYRRIFVTQRFCMVVWIALALVIGWFISTLSAIIFQCTPVEGAWNQPAAKHCINARAFFLGNGTASMIMDVLILCLPMPMVWRLQLNRKRKLALTGMFLLGSFVCVISSVRIKTLISTEREDFSYSETQAETWSCVEPCVGIVCGCLPTLGPLIKTSVRKAYLSRNRRGSSFQRIAPPNHDSRGYSDPDLENNSNSCHKKAVEATNTLSSVTVTTDVEMDRFGH